ncbi:MAG: class I SAM-dependent methyltransferase [Anaerolineales bacterium]|nr:class I SAM-dependent methyltransferase [Anaerolineales bacterium]
MSVSEKLMAQGKKPTGLLGSLIGSLMNANHKNIYRFGLEALPIGQNWNILDIGCGGGQAVNLLAARVKNGKVHGIDHSVEMVTLARKVNRKHIREGRVEIEPGSVVSLPYPDRAFEVVTAFETIQFWPQLENSLKEVSRVLKSSGIFLILNRYPDLEGKDAHYAEFLQIHSLEDYREYLSITGFADIGFDSSTKPGWILVTARKP